MSNVELDPWGADTNRSSNTAFQPQSFTSYIRDANGGQDAMARRYSIGGRFAQPDSYGGSYDFSDPQSLNRYAYTKNDPVNFRDPSGMVMSEFCGAEYSFVACGGNGGFWGGGDFGGHVAEYNREYEGLPANIAGAMRLIDQRIGNARGGLGFLTSAEILAGGRATSAHAWIIYDGAYYDADGVVWSSSDDSRSFGRSPLMGSLDQWPPKLLDRTFGWGEPRTPTTRVTVPGSEPIKMVPQRGTPGIEISRIILISRGLTLGIRNFPLT